MFVENLKKEEIFKKDFSNLRFGILHSQIGYSDGVSIVIQQMENILINRLGVPKENIFYLVGKSKFQSSNITEKEIFLEHVFYNFFNSGIAEDYVENLDKKIEVAGKEVQNFVEKNNLNILIGHNTSHLENFLLSAGISRYYKNSKVEGKKVPKYIVWWHDSHLEREHLSRPLNIFNELIYEGVPGPFVDHILFINHLQFKIAEEYFLEIDKRFPGFYERIKKNHDVVFNTTDVFINCFYDLSEQRIQTRTGKFIEDFGVGEVLKSHNLKGEDVLFCLQHTRIVKRKRIDFALKFCFEFLQKCKREGAYKAIYFLVSGLNREDWTKQELIELHDYLSRGYNEKNVFLVFAEDFKTEISFEDYPLIFANLGGFSTYFSEVEGFGNNLLEVLASGLLPVIYEYPVYKADLANFNFNLIKTSHFEVSSELVEEVYEMVINIKKKERWVDENLEILRKNLSHELIAEKLKKNFREVGLVKPLEISV